MSDQGKKRLSAKQILSDIRSGVDGTRLKRKYGLSDRALESVLGKLVAAGALTEQDMRRLKSSPGDAPTSREMPGGLQWRCPACNTPQRSEMSECPACGVVVAKFVAPQRQGPPGPATFRGSTRDHESSAGGGWSYVVWSVVVLALIGGAVIAWSTHRSNLKAEIAALDKLRPESQQVPGALGEKTVNEPGASIEYPPSVMDSFKNSSGDRTHSAGVPQTHPTESKSSPESRPADSTKYVTGVLRQFTASDFRKEVVEASKTYPVLFQFYSDT